MAGSPASGRSQHPSPRLHNPDFQSRNEGFSDTCERPTSDCRAAPQDGDGHPRSGSASSTTMGAGPQGEVVEVGPRSMHVLFDSSMEPSLIQFDDPQWMDYITFDE